MNGFKLNATIQSKHTVLDFDVYNFTLKALKTITSF
jgi:hypothetical protein